MSNIIDERVVSLGFDTKKFAEGTKSALSNLKSFKNKFDFGDLAQSTKKHLASIKNVTDKTTKSLVASASNLGSKLKSSVNLDGIKDKLASAKTAGANTFSKLTSSASNLGSKLKSSVNLDGIKDKFSGLKTAGANAFSKLTSSASNLGSKLKSSVNLDGIKDKFSSVKTAGTSAFSKLTSSASNLGSKLKSSVNLDGIKDKFSSVKTAGTSAFSKLTSSASNLGSKLKSSVNLDGIKDKFSSVKTAGTNAFSKLTSSASNLGSKLKSSVNLDGIKDKFSSVKTAGTSAFSKLTSSASNLGSKLKSSVNLDGIKDKFSSVKTAGTSAFSKLTSSASNLGSKLKSSVNLDGIKDKFSSVKTAGTSAFSKLTSSASNLGSKLKSSVNLDGIKDKFSSVKTAGTNAFSKLTSSASNLGSKLKSSVNLDGIKDKFSGLKTAGANAFSKLTSGASNLGSKMSGIGKVAAVAGAAIGGIFLIGKKRKKDLNFDGASEGLKKVGATAGNTSAELLATGQAVDVAKHKFSALEIMGVTALANITNAAVNVGKRIVSALTIDPIKTGFSEYETKINAIQTIMSNTASKGTTMDDVTKVIGELNEYADKTIYNFAEMTKNIGTFTAAGIGLEESAAAIQGIANLAAASGSNSQQASTAMYQLSQALSTGTVRLMDWNSVVNAGMGGEKFQEALKATAREYGVAVDDIIEKSGSFRESLSEEWLTADILNETLKKFTTGGAQDYAKSMIEAGKWTQAQADALLKEAQAMEDAATKVKTFTQLWDTLKESAQSGWSQTWEIIIGDFEEAKETLTEFSNVIGKMLEASANARNELLQGWKDAGGRADLIDSLYNVFNGILSIIKPIKEAFNEIFPPMTIQQLVGFTKGLKELTAKFKLSDTASENLKRTFKGLFAVLDIIRHIVMSAVKAVGSLFGSVSDLGGGVLGVTASFGDFLVKISEFIKKGDVFGKTFRGIASVIKVIISGISKFIGWVSTNLVFPGLNGLYSLFGKIYDSITRVTEAAGNMGSSLANSSFFKMLQTLWNGIVKIGSGIIGGIGKVLGGLFNSIASGDFQGVINFINGLIGGGIGIAIMRFVDSLREPFESFGGIMEGLGDCLEGFSMKLKADALLKIAAAVGILALSAMVLSNIDKDKLADALSAITVLFVELASSLAIVNKITSASGGFGKACTAMISMSIAVLILASALKKISDLEVGELAVGLLGVAGLMTILVAAAKVMERESKTVIKGAGQMILMAIALKVLASVCKTMASFEWGELAKGTTGIVLLLGILIGAAKLMATDGSKMTKGAGQMLIMAAALTVMAAALKIVVSMSWEELGRGFTGLLAITAILVATAKLMATDGTKMTKGAGQMLIMAASLAILAGVLKIVASMSWEELGRGLVGLVAALGLMVGVLATMSMIKGAAGSAASILIMAVALGVLAPVLMLLGLMSWESIAKGLVTIAAAFAIIGIAGALLAPVVPAILGLSVAMALLGVGILAAGVGLVAFGAGLTLLATGFITLTASLGAIVTGIIGVITAIAVGLANGIVAFCQVIVGGMPTIGKAIKTLILTLCDVIIECAPDLMKAVGVLLEELLAFLIKYIPKIVDAGIEIIVALLEGIASRIDDIVDAAADVIIAFIKGIGDGALKIIEAGVDMMIDFVNGLAQGIRDNTDRMIEAVNNLMDAIMYAIKAWFTNAKEQGGSLVGEIISGIKGKFADMKQAGKDAIKGFINGIKEKISAVGDAASEVGKKALNSIKNFLGINSPSKEFAAIGRFSGEGMVTGLTSYSGKVATAAEKVGAAALNTVRNTVSSIADAFNNNVDGQPTIRPVLDLSDVESGAGRLGSLLNTGATYGLMTNVGSISSMMNHRSQDGTNADIISELKDLKNSLGNIGSTSYNINGVTYDDGSNIAEAVKSIARAAKIERRT